MHAADSHHLLQILLVEMRLVREFHMNQRLDNIDNLHKHWSSEHNASTGI
jgi:hypothetical protein